MTDRKLDLKTLCAHGGVRSPEERGANDPFVPPIVQSTIFDLGSAAESEALFSGQTPGYMYTRFGNPTVDRLSEILQAMEGGGGALITASGNAATLCAVTMALRGENDRVLALQDLYGGSLEIMRILRERFNVPVEIIDPRNEAEWLAAVDRASVIYLESPSNPMLRLIDIAAVTERAHRNGAKVIVDNTVATPFNQLPLALGADYVVHSMSKYLNGHSDMIGGCVISRAALTPAEKSVHKNLGGTVNAMDAWLMHRGLRTFALRMEAHNSNGQAVAEFLAAHPAVGKVYFPGLPGNAQMELFRKQMKAGGALLSFELKGGEAVAIRFLDRIRLVVHAVSLGGMESLATRPAGTSHRGMPAEMKAAAGVTDSLIRLSVGVEEIGDLLADLDQALR